MKIEGLRTTVVAVPIRRASTSTWYGSDRRVAVIVDVFTDAGCWALNAIDMALWDIAGKACGQPLYKVWGGAFRKQIDFYGPIDAAGYRRDAGQGQGG